MAMSSSGSHMSLTSAQVEPVVRRAYPELADVGTWRVTQLARPTVTETEGVVRLDGEGWSLVLKVVRAGSEREFRTYASGLLPHGTTGLRAAVVFGRTEVDGASGLWLEALPTDEARRQWDPVDFAEAARHLGEFGVRVVLPRDVTWLERHDLSSFGAIIDEGVTWLREAGEDARVHRIYPATAQRLVLSWDRNRKEAFDALETSDWVCCHGDAQRRNLFRLGDATVAIDWARFGTGPVGTDLVTLLRQGATNFELDTGDLDRNARQITRAHIAGLVRAGWRADAERLRRSLAAQHILATLIELRPNLRLALLPDRARWAEDYYGRPFDSIADRRRQVVDWTIETHATPL